jgi:hypothetical protein
MHNYLTMKYFSILLVSFFLLIKTATAQPVIYANQVGFDTDGPKIALIGIDQKLSENPVFDIVEIGTNKTAFSAKAANSESIDEWTPGKFYYRADFSSFATPGSYKISATIAGKQYFSSPFVIEENALAKRTIGAIIHYYNKQRANTPAELAADSHMRMIGSDKTVDIHGGWCDASGDVSKYFSHLAYANFMSPQQIPLVVWSMASASEAIPALLTEWGVKDSLDNEALYGADYMMRALSKDDYFYMTVFSYFNKDPEARRIVGLHANSVTTNEYQCAFREGGGMGIAALARISRWKKNGEFTSQQYLDAAKLAFAHLLINNTKYDDDGKENIIDD